MPPSYDDLLRAARAEIPEITPAGVTALPVPPVLVDVREAVEWDAGHLPGAYFVARSRLEQDIEARIPDRAAPVVLYCEGGIRSLFAGQALRALGYTHVRSMAGGYRRWLLEGNPVERPTPPRVDGAAPAGTRSGDVGPEGSPPESIGDGARRYARQVLMPEVGQAGQARLLASRVLIVGAGGLGSPAALYLAGAGVGTLRIVDFDDVDVSNLQRQVLHSTQRLGWPKVESATQALTALNPDVRIDAHREALTRTNADTLVAGCDAILDATDSFETRYALNDAAVAAGIPLVHASVFRFEGQLSTFVPGAGPCYRCLHPSPPPPELAPACSVAGVLGVVPGVMGTLQASEVLKLLLGIGEPLVGRLLLFDALQGAFTEVRIRRDPGCPACGDAVSRHETAARMTAQPS